MEGNTSISQVLAHCLPPLAADVIQRLHRHGHAVHVVGGPVRDAWLGRPIADWDVATSARKQQILDLFADLHRFSTGGETVTLLRQGERVEATPFRGRRCSIGEDLAHRDFTLNAMAWDPWNGRILDPADGLADMAKRVIRAVGDPAERFREDPLRLLRGVRLVAETGFRLAPDTRRVMQELSDLLKETAAERVRDELLKLLLSPRPDLGLRLLHRTGLLTVVIPELAEGHRKQQNRWHRYTVLRHVQETLRHTPPEPVLRLAALLHDVGKPQVREKHAGSWRFPGHETAGARLTAEILRRLRFRERWIRQVTHLVRQHMIHYHPDWSDAAVRRLIRRAGDGAAPTEVLRLVRLRRADMLAHGQGPEPAQVLDELTVRILRELNRRVPTQARHLAVNGRDVMRVLDIPPSPRVGAALRELLERVTETPELNTRVRLLAELVRIRAKRTAFDWPAG